MEMRENVLKRVWIQEEKNGTKYAKKSGAAYSRLRILYTLAGIYTLGIHLLFLLGFWMTDKIGEFKTEVTVIAACTALLVAGYILTYFKWDLPALVASVIPAAVLIVLFSRMLEAEVITNNIFRYKPSYYYRHFAPLLLMILIITVMTVIALREKKILKKEYRQVVENLYQAYREKQGEAFHEEDWQAFLEQYDPERHQEIFEK